MIILEQIRYYFFMLWVWVGHKCFGWHYIDIYSPGADKDPDAEVLGITFTSDENYARKVQEVEV